MSRMLNARNSPHLGGEGGGGGSGTYVLAEKDLDSNSKKCACVKKTL